MVESIQKARTNYLTYLTKALIELNELAGHSSPGGFVGLTQLAVETLKIRIPGPPLCARYLEATGLLAGMAYVLELSNAECIEAEQETLVGLNCCDPHDEARKEG